MQEKINQNNFCDNDRIDKNKYVIDKNITDMNSSTNFTEKINKINEESRQNSYISKKKLRSSNINNQKSKKIQRIKKKKLPYKYSFYNITKKIRTRYHQFLIKHINILLKKNGIEKTIFPIKPDKAKKMSQKMTSKLYKKTIKDFFKMEEKNKDMIDEIMKIDEIKEFLNKVYLDVLYNLYLMKSNEYKKKYGENEFLFENDDLCDNKYENEIEKKVWIIIFNYDLKKLNDTIIPRKMRINNSNIDIDENNSNQSDSPFLAIDRLSYQNRKLKEEIYDTIYCCKFQIFLKLLILKCFK
jgi:hypothetical protein